MRAPLLLIARIALVIGLVPLLLVGVPFSLFAIVDAFSSHRINYPYPSGGLNYRPLLDLAPWAGLAMFGWILKHLAARLPDSRGVPEKTPWDSVVRSLFVCGLGQIHNGQIWKGIVLLPIASAFYVISFFFLMSLAPWEKNVGWNKFLISFAVIGAIWVINLIDAYRGAVRNVRSNNSAKPGAA